MDLLTWRKSKGLTQEQAAAKAKVEQSLWSKWERGIAHPTLESAVRIIEATKGEVTLQELAKKGPGAR